MYTKNESAFFPVSINSCITKNIRFILIKNQGTQNVETCFQITYFFLHSTRNFCIYFKAGSFKENSTSIVSVTFSSQLTRPLHSRKRAANIKVHYSIKQFFFL